MLNMNKTDSPTKPDSNGDLATGGGFLSRSRANPWVVLAVLCTGFFMILLDSTIVNIAIPSIIDNLQASLDQILWVLNAYVLVYAVLLITAGRMGDLWGQRTLFAIGLSLFTIGSATCGLAQDMNQLIAARVLQGLGGALLTPQTLSILTNIFPADRRGAAFGIWGGVAGIAAIAGPTLGGLIVTSSSWRWIFFVNLPIGIVALAATFVFIPDFRPGRKHSLDLVGILLATTGLFFIVFGLVEGERYDWGAIWGWLNIPEVIAAGFAILLGFVAWERTQTEPLIPLSLFKNRNYSIMNSVVTAMGFTFVGIFLPLTIYFQAVLGMTALEAGLAMAPMPLTMMLVAPWSGRLADKTGGKYFLMMGLLVFAAGMGMLLWVATPESTWTTFLVPLIIAGFGLGNIMAPSSTIAMRHVSPRLAGGASGVFNTTRQLGAVLGSSVVGAVLQNQLSTSLHNQAVAYSTKLPAQAQQAFINSFNGVAKSGIEFGRSAGSDPQLAAGIPPQIADLVRTLGRTVFVNGFTDAIRPTIMVPIAFLVLAAVACLAVEGKKQASARADSASAYGTD
ncbi:MAG: DHA2 family efflux MFS transporter permease subunit [Dehalococcoidia bacterium]|nr:DHA2 family efflux MFS transporter permease subunit [Dehalococcoidia bacterium]